MESAAYNLIGYQSARGITTSGGNFILGNSLAITSILNTNLAFNGGPTRTHALVPGSLAINAGLNSGAAGLAYDQRGPNFLRIVAGTVDIGAFELEATAPTITCPSSLVMSSPPGLCSATNLSFAASATGLPAPAVVYQLNNAVITSPASFNVGTNLVTCTASNIAGVTNCSFTVTVRDAQVPTLTCPASFTNKAPYGANGLTVNFPTPVATDNCGPVSTLCVPPTDSFLLLGTNPIVCTATDAAGNTKICSFNITIEPTVCILTVQNTNASGPRSLRQGILDSSSAIPCTIILAPATCAFAAADNFWSGPNALPPIVNDVTLEGNGATLRIPPGSTRRRPVPPATTPPARASSRCAT